MQRAYAFLAHRGPRAVLVAFAACGLVAAASAKGQSVEMPLVLDVNFNGMVHSGEDGQPDATDGFRSISDRALIVDGASMSVGDLTSIASGLSYDVVDAAGVLDILHLGNRNTVDGGNWMFDAMADGDDIGIQPDWLPDSDQSTTVQVIDPGIGLGTDAEIGFLYQASNGGGDFDVTLGFADATEVTVTLNAPDWFGPFGGMPGAPGPGVALQQNLGTDFTGAENIDSGDPGATLIVTEAVVSASALGTDLGFDVDGKTLTSLTFGNASNPDAGHAVVAITVRGQPAGGELPIPTLGTVGLLALVLLLAAAATTMLRR